MTADDIDLQRRRDGAFFEDWSEWRDFGVSQWWRGEGAAIRVRIGMPSYGCRLRDDAPPIGASTPMFELIIPSDVRIARLVSAIDGAKRYQGRAYRDGPFEVWFVSAEHWVALRRALPEIKRITVSKVGGLT